jgi:hypothetical protein
MKVIRSSIADHPFAEKEENGGEDRGLPSRSGPGAGFAKDGRMRFFPF